MDYTNSHRPCLLRSRHAGTVNGKDDFYRKTIIRRSLPSSTRSQVPSDLNDPSMVGTLVGSRWLLTLNHVWGRRDEEPIRLRLCTKGYTCDWGRTDVTFGGVDTGFLTGKVSERRWPQRTLVESLVYDVSVEVEVLEDLYIGKISSSSIKIINLLLCTQLIHVCIYPSIFL